MTTGTPCFQYVNQADAVQNYVQRVDLIWMQFNNPPLTIHNLFIPIICFNKLKAYYSLLIYKIHKPPPTILYFLSR